MAEHNGPHICPGCEPGESLADNPAAAETGPRESELRPSGLRRSGKVETGADPAQLVAHDPFTPQQHGPSE